MGRNAKESKWASTSNELRKRKRFELTLPPATLEKLEALATARGVSRSEVVEQLVDAAPARSHS